MVNVNLFENGCTKVCDARQNGSSTGKKKCIVMSQVPTDAYEKKLLELVIQDGYSDENTTMIRGDIQEVYGLLNTGEYDCVYVQNFPCITKTKEGVIDFADNLASCGVQLVLGNGNFRLLNVDGSREDGFEMLISIYFQMVESEKRVIQERMKRVRQAKKEIRREVV